MSSNHESFFEHQSFAVVGHTSRKPFPRLTFAGLKKHGKKVFAVDPSANSIDGDATFPDLTALPEPVEAVVVEVPRDETRAWVEKAAAAGIKDVWLHMNSETPEALALAREKGLNVRYGTCAVQYVDSTFPHNVHKVIRKVLGRY